jgi:predicted Zn-dependent protease
MMGGLLAQLPWLFGGDTGLAEDYLKRAIAADANYTHSHILLAQLYIKQERFPLACPHLQAVIQATHPHYPYTWRYRFKPEAEALLRALPAHARACSHEPDR